ncbi:MAG: putative glycosyltransferase, partial [Bacteroidota bacterium]
EERNARIVKRMELIAERCPAGGDREILHGLAREFALTSVEGRVRRFLSVAKYHRAMLAYKGKSALGSLLYSFKLLFSIF